jgi:hypothetical protein
MPSWSHESGTLLYDAMETIACVNIHECLFKFLLNNHHQLPPTLLLTSNFSFHRLFICTSTDIIFIIAVAPVDKTFREFVHVLIFIRPINI